MKKCLYLMLVILILLTLLSGCGEEDPQPQIYEKPTFTPGVMESELLAAEPGNFERICNTGSGNGNYLEIETGYYVNWWSYLYYAEKTDLNSWYYVCNDPDCKHSSYDCSSYTGSNGVWYADGKIYFSDDTGPYKHLRGNDPAMMGLFRMDENGENLELVHTWKGSANAGYAASFEVVPGGYLVGAEVLRPDGSYNCTVFLYTLDGKMQVLLDEVNPEMLTSRTTHCTLHEIYLGGDLSVISAIFTHDTKYTNTLCWFQNGEPVFTDISEIPAWGGYLQGNIIRCFDPGKGYYDIDLLTGERTKLADAQLENSKARILQPNCIIETTLLNPESAVGTQEMRFFDGQQWHAVTLPEELLVSNDTFEVLALSSDRVIFTVRQYHAYDNEKDTMVWYCMKLDGETYTVEPMGTFQKPTGAGLADQP